MTHLIKSGLKVVAAVPEHAFSYAKALKDIDVISKRHKLTVADMPLAILAICSNYDLRKDIRPGAIDVASAEYYGIRDDNHSYEIWHSTGSLTTLQGLEHAITEDKHDFFNITAAEWHDIGNGSFNGADVPRYHLYDIKKGESPKPGKPHTIFVRPDKDKPNINPNPFQKLEYGPFMNNDRVLMIAGSLEGREMIANMLFGREGKYTEKNYYVGNHHRIKSQAFEETPKGSPLFLDERDGGFKHQPYFNGAHRFIAASQTLLQPK